MYDIQIGLVTFDLAFIYVPMLFESQLYPYEEGTTTDILGSTFNPRSPSPTKYPFRPPSGMNALHPLSGTPHTLTRSPSPLSGSMSQVHGQSRAVGLNDIMDNPTELEYFKVVCVYV